MFEMEAATSSRANARRSVVVPSKAGRVVLPTPAQDATSTQNKSPRVSAPSHEILPVMAPPPSRHA